MSASLQTDRFLRELETAKAIVATANKRGLHLTLAQAHSVWAEYSERMCAGWMAVDDEDPEAEIWREITIWQRNNHP